MRFTSVKTTDGNKPFLFNELRNGETLQFLISETVDLNQFFYQNKQLVEVRNLFEKAQEVAGLDSVKDFMKFKPNVE